jgi:hypothetical protein
LKPNVVTLPKKAHKSQKPSAGEGEIVGYRGFRGASVSDEIKDGIRRLEIGWEL